MYKLFALGCNLQLLGGGLKKGTSQTGIQTVCFVALKVLSDKDDLQVVMQHLLLEIDFSQISVLLSTVPWPKAKANLGIVMIGLIQEFYGIFFFGFVFQYIIAVKSSNSIGSSGGCSSVLK